jgi:hypothetical protein
MVVSRLLWTSDLRPIGSLAITCRGTRANYDDFGGNYFDCIHSGGPKRYPVKGFEQSGPQVTLEAIEAA